MPGIVVCVEPNQIAMKNPQEQSLSNWENSVDLAAGKWCMQEETNLDILLSCADLLSQHLW